MLIFYRGEKTEISDNILKYLKQRSHSLKLLSLLRLGERNLRPQQVMFIIWLLSLSWLTFLILI